MGRLISDFPFGQQYQKWGEPLGRFGWQLLSRFCASGAGTANILPSFTNPQSILWRTCFEREAKVQKPPPQDEGGVGVIALVF